MWEIFNEKAELQRWLDVECALADVEASLGLIPKKAAREICTKAKVKLIDEEERLRSLDRTGHPIVALIYSLKKVCKGGAGEYIHWGPTTQDIIDTGDQMAMKAAHQIIFDSLREIEENLLEIAERETNTVMAGRTHGQHALPITFGYKVAVWLREIRRHIERLKESRKRLFVGLLSGAVGTYASLGEKGPEIEALVMRKLGLEPPDICWAASRDRNAEFAYLVAMCASSLGKIANEVYNLQRTEVAELEEPIGETAVGSSTMPQKRNPRLCETVIGFSKRIKYYAVLQMDGMGVEHERGNAGWYIQRDTLGEMCLLIGDLLAKMKIITKGLKINVTSMEKNLNITRGLILSEAVMLELGLSIGKQTAHEVVYDAAMKASQCGMSLKDVLLEDVRVTKHMTPEDLDIILDPTKYVGLAPKITRDMITLTREERVRD